MSTVRTLIKWALVALAVAGVCGGAYLVWRGLFGPENAPRGDGGGPRLPGFVSAAPDAGLDFRMQFLPQEQGEAFKINLYDHGCGVAVGDYDGDGRDDIYFLNQLGANALFRNRGDGTFEETTDSVGPIGLGDRICVSAAFNDYDNDGDQDLFVTSTRGGNALFQNRQGRFWEVTEEAGLEWFGHSQTATFFDYDRDGFLDLFLINSASWTTDEYDAEQGYFRGLDGLLQDRPYEHNVMYHNRGNGTFEDVTAALGLQGIGWGGDAVVFDYDVDGRTDLLVTKMFGPSQLYRNEEDGRFRDVTGSVLGVTSFGTIGAKALDYNNDGRLDLFVTDMHSDMWMDQGYDLRMVDEERKYASAGGPFAFPGTGQDEAEIARERFGMNVERVVFGNTFFENLGGGQFWEVSDAAHLETFWPWGVATGDFDNDGYEDVFVPSGMGYPFGYWPNYLLMNGGDGTFYDEAYERGIEPPLGGAFQAERIGGRRAARSSRSAAVADFDGDGRLEIVTNNFNDAPYFFRNAFPRQNYIAFRLTGTKSNRDAIGALVTCHVGDDVLVRQVHAAGGYLAQSTKTLHFGLGDRTKVDRVEIRWPSGRVQVLEAPAANRLWGVVEE